MGASEMMAIISQSFVSDVKSTDKKFCGKKPIYLGGIAHFVNEEKSSEVWNTRQIARQVFKSRRRGSAIMLDLITNPS